jgi:hypothetical protein
MLEEQYSGEKSEKFWELVNLLDDDDSTLYKIGCDLQNLESEVLGKLNKRRASIEKLKRTHDSYVKRKKRKK